MKANVGSYDCAARFVVGCVAMLIGNHYFSWWGLVGLAPILSAIIGFCPMYAILGLNSTACDQHAHHFKDETDGDVAPRVTVKSLRPSRQ